MDHEIYYMSKCLEQLVHYRYQGILHMIKILNVYNLKDITCTQVSLY